MCVSVPRWNHHLLSTVEKRPDWLTIPLGEPGVHRRRGARRGARPRAPEHGRCARPPTSPTAASGCTWTAGRSDVYDHVVLATHGDQAYAIVKGEATKEEAAILSSFHTSENTAVLHSDLSLMPARRKAWASWNYLTLSGAAADGQPGTAQVSLTYDMNILQHIPAGTFGDVLVTLNPLHEPDPATVQGR